MEVIGVRFKKAGKIYYFDPLDLEFEMDQAVIVETSQGVELGYVGQLCQDVSDSEVSQPLKPIIRIATVQDIEQSEQIAEKEKEALALCTQKIEEHHLDMHLVDVEQSFLGNKITFYFTSDGRVDFRELVKDLAGIFKMRIELRQIGVRDEARLIGGLGSCGRVVCCKSFLNDFHPVSIKMAKEQSLSLSPTKISGICGRLMCCLQYEQSCYEATRKRMPKIGREIITSDGKATVIANLIVPEKVKVRIKLSDGSYEVREYPLEEIQQINPVQKHAVSDDSDTVISDLEKIDTPEEVTLDDFEDSIDQPIV